MTRVPIASLAFALACSATQETDPPDPAAVVQAPDLPDDVIPCDASVRPLPLDLARDAHRDLFEWSEDRSELQPAQGAEWAAGLDYFADQVELPRDLPTWLQPAWPPPPVSQVDTSQDTSAWSRQEQWEPPWEDTDGHSEPGYWWYQGDVRFDEQGRQTGFRKEPVLSSSPVDWTWTAFGDDGWTQTRITRSDGRWWVRDSVTGLHGEPVALRSSGIHDTEEQARSAPMTAWGQLWHSDPWGRTLYVRELKQPDGYRADIRSVEWLDLDGVAYRPMIEAAMYDILGQESEAGFMDGRYELNQGQTLVELGVVGTQKVSTRCVRRTPRGVRQDTLSYVVDDETGDISDLGVVSRLDGERVGGAGDRDGDGVLDHGSDERISSDGLRVTRFDWELQDGERVETVREVLYLDPQGRPVREVRVVDGQEMDHRRWIHPD